MSICVPLEARKAPKGPQWEGGEKWGAKVPEGARGGRGKGYDFFLSFFGIVFFLSAFFLFRPVPGKSRPRTDYQLVNQEAPVIYPPMACVT